MEGICIFECNDWFLYATVMLRHSLYFLHANLVCHFRKLPVTLDSHKIDSYAT